MNRPVPGDPALARKGRAAQTDAKMALARSIVTRMARMLAALVDHRDFARRKARTQSRFDLFNFAQICPQNISPNPLHLWLK